MVSIKRKWVLFFLFAFFLFPIGLRAVENPEPAKKPEPAKQAENPEPAKKAEPAKQAENPEPAKKAEPAKQVENQEPVKKAEPVKQTEKQKASQTIMPPPMDSATESKSSTSTSSSESKDVETMEVTGSYIRRSDMEGPSPIVVIEREELQRSGIQTVSNFLLRYNTVASFGGNGFRGLGEGRQLVLINGQRAPASGSSYGLGPSGAVSTSLIPMAAVERIEILKDGASAIYGSDALTGVINIITRKDLDGMAVESNINVNDIKGGDSLRVAGVYGDTFSKGNFLTSLQYTHGTSRRTADDKLYEFSENAYWRSTNLLVRTPAGPVVYTSPDCKRFNEREFCEDNITAESVSNPSHNLDWVTDARYKFSNDVEVYSTFYLGWNQSSSKTFSPVLETPEDIGFSFGPNESPSSWGLQNNDVILFHRITELPGMESKSQNLSGGLIVGLNGYWGSSDWIWDISLNNQVSHANEEANNMALEAPVRNAIQKGVYDPFGTARNTDGFSYNASGWDRYLVNWLDMKTTGNMGSFFGFDWSSAFGISAANFAYKDDGDDMARAGRVMGLKSVDARGDRQLYAAFAELSGIYNNLEFNLALRGDHYSDFGSTFNPKVGLKYQAMDWLGIRASWGTGFKAPTLQQAYGPTLPYFVQLTDWKKCLATGASEQDCQEDWIRVNEGGNPNLKEETSQSFNAGIFFEPNENLFLSVDYWNVAVNDVIDFDLNTMLRVAAVDPTAYERYNIKVNPDPNPMKGGIGSVETLLTNAGDQRSDGIDVNGSFRIPVSFIKGNISMKTELTYIFNYYRQLEDQILDELGKGFSGGTPRWRNITSLSYNTGPLTATITGRAIGKYERKAAQGNNIPSFIQYDIGINYQSPWGGIFNLGAINAFDGYPEYDVGTTYPLDTALYAPDRTFFFGYRQDF